MSRNDIVSFDESLFNVYNYHYVPEVMLQLKNEPEIDDIINSENTQVVAVKDDVDTVDKQMSPSKLCVICGDHTIKNTLGFKLSYGAYTCRACESFFAKNAGKTLTCSSGEDCAITKSTRINCQYCRLKKCYTVGMKKGYAVGKNPSKKSTPVKLNRFIPINQQVSCKSLPPSKKCLICSVVFVHRNKSGSGRKSSISPSVCYNCQRTFNSRVTNSNPVPQCVSGAGDCIVSFLDRTKCKYCLTKKSFEVGLRTNYFTEFKLDSNSFLMRTDDHKNDDVNKNDIKALVEEVESECRALALIPSPPTLKRKRSSTDSFPSPKKISRSDVTCCLVCVRKEKVCFYYGSTVCELCMKFFRRSVLKKKIYACSDNEFCSLMKSKDFCKYCRLKLCLEAGMDNNEVKSSDQKSWKLMERRDYADYEIEDILQGTSDCAQLAIAASSFADNGKTEIEEMDTEDDVKVIDETNLKVCQVCSNPKLSSVDSIVCKKCYSFAKRPQKKGLKCQFDGNCELTHGKVNWYKDGCKACRYAKCLEVGLSFPLVTEKDNNDVFDTVKQEEHDQLKKEFVEPGLQDNSDYCKSECPADCVMEEVVVEEAVEEELEATEEIELETIQSEAEVSTVECDSQETDIGTDNDNRSQQVKNEVETEIAVSDQPCDVCGKRDLKRPIGHNTDWRVCNACYHFFLTSEKRLNKYICKKNNACDIVYGVSFCSSCRLDKCVKVGISFPLKYSKDVESDSEVGEVDHDDRNEFVVAEKVEKVEEKVDPDRTCGVCGRSKMTNVYGVKRGYTVCSACNLFFFRHSSNSYDCLKSKNCAVTYVEGKNMKKVCRYCRLQKCFSVGMALTFSESDQEESEEAAEECDEVFIEESEGVQFINDAINQRCEVCNNVKFSLFFGAIVCNACMQFFKRSVLQPQPFTCSFNQSCDVNFTNSPSCRFCRFKKCLTVGMNIQGLRTGRDRTVSVKRTTYTEEQIVSMLNGSALDVLSERSCCPVCHKETALDMHFGVMVCTTCFNFFGAFVRFRHQYACDYVQNCSISSKKSRNCKFCLLKKCLQVGMNVRGLGTQKALNSTLPTPVANYSPAEIDEIMSGNLNSSHCSPIHTSRDLPHTLDGQQSSKPIIPTNPALKESYYRKLRLHAAMLITQRQGIFQCPDCLAEFDDPTELFFHLKEPHQYDEKRYSHYNERMMEESDSELEHDDYDEVDSIYEETEEEIHLEPNRLVTDPGEPVFDPDDSISDESDDGISTKSENITDKKLIKPRKIKHYINKGWGASPQTSCDICTHVIRASYVKPHFKKWHENGTIKCEQCDAYFVRKREAAIHMLEVHKITSPINCGKCGETHDFVFLNRHGKVRLVTCSPLTGAKFRPSKEFYPKRRNQSVRSRKGTYVITMRQRLELAMLAKNGATEDIIKAECKERFQVDLSTGVLSKIMIDCDQLVTELSLRLDYEEHVIRKIKEQYPNGALFREALQVFIETQISEFPDIDSIAECNTSKQYGYVRKVLESHKLFRLNPTKNSPLKQ